MCCGPSTRKNGSAATRVSQLQQPQSTGPATLPHDYHSADFVTSGSGSSPTTTTTTTTATMDFVPGIAAEKWISLSDGGLFRTQAAAVDASFVDNSSAQQSAMDLFPSLVNYDVDLPAKTVMVTQEEFLSRPQQSRPSVEDWIASIGNSGAVVGGTDMFAQALMDPSMRTTDGILHLQRAPLISPDDLSASVPMVPWSTANDTNSESTATVFSSRPAQLPISTTRRALLSVDCDTTAPCVPAVTEGKRAAGVSKAELKRMKNTEAARQSRRRKNDLLRGLESKVEEVELRNKELERDNAVLKTENTGYFRRVEALEKQVDELHNVLLAFGASAAKRSVAVVTSGSSEASKRVKSEVSV